MATGTSVGTGNWNTAAGNKTLIGSPALGDLIVVIHGMSGWASGDDSTITDNNADGLGTYTKLGTASAPLATGGGTSGALWFSVRDALIGSATATTFTATNSGDTGGGLTVLRFSGMTRTGADAILQSIGESTKTENPPTITLGSTTLTDNPVILACLGEDNPLALTPPTGFSEATDDGWGVPTTGIEVCWDDAGNTATLFSWSGGASTDHCEIGVELDTTHLIAATGIASGEAFGSSAVSATVGAAGIASAEAVGQPSVGSSSASIDCDGAGIATAEAIGAPAASASIAAAAVSSAEAIGSPVIGPTIEADGIATAEAHGSQAVAASVAGAGVASAEAIGSPGVAAGIAGTGIASAEAIGQPAVGAAAATIDLDGAGIASDEAHGSQAIGVLIDSAGIASAEAIGSAALAAGVTSVAIASAEAHGSPAIAAQIEAAGVASAEALGQPALDGGIAAQGIASAESVSAPALSVDVIGTGIASLEAIGLPFVGAVPAQIDCTGILSGEAFGSAVVGPAIVGAGGIASAAAFGQPTLADAADAQLRGISIMATELAASSRMAATVRLPGVITTTLRGYSPLSEVP